MKPEVVVHFHKEGMQPRMVVVKAGEFQVNVVLEPMAGIPVHNCETLKRGDRRIGWGQHGLQFHVSEAIAEVGGGKPDVDYVRYGVRREGSKSERFLELWFGPYAMDADPDDDLVVNSVNFQQQAIVVANGQLVGFDSSGRLRGRNRLASDLSFGRRSQIQ